LTAVSGEGEAVVTPPPAVGWPIRLEFSVQPGAFTHLEVLAAQRVVYQVPAAGKVTVFRLDPSALKPSTPAITLRWSAAAGSEH
ncbi:MAG TPA: hypothetical protein VHZ99_10670, partial [Steroidobacteraceae bacterium]|nr:hypothetical protein [Steroidobacteraceae bacterium]